MRLKLAIMLRFEVDVHATFDLRRVKGNQEIKTVCHERREQPYSVSGLQNVWTEKVNGMKTCHRQKILPATIVDSYMEGTGSATVKKRSLSRN